MANAIVSSAMDDLEATGVLQHSNCMDIAELLNPAVETHNLFEVTDEDIFKTVMVAKEAREANVGGSDEVFEQNVQVVEEQIITRQEALQAAVALQKYVNTLEDPISRQFESFAAVNSLSPPTMAGLMDIAIIVEAAQTSNLPPLVVVNKYSAIASAIMISYDHLLTLPAEIDFVWTAGWSVGKCLYLFTHYFGLITLISYVISAFSEDMATEQMYAIMLLPLR
ncbi:hypothetical protein BU17DRAFT_85044 [Hysterangium stoloniferum]|nr:hypothetical protein BU17DRAFT_85044 [Hysterangium stoloniferum]